MTIIYLYTHRFFYLFFFQILSRLHNYNTLMAVIGGVTHSNIARLSKTISALSSNIKKVSDVILILP